VILGSAIPDRNNAAILSAAPAPARSEAENKTPSAPDSTFETQKLQNAVLQALSENNQRILVSMLSAGEWSVGGNELAIKVGESQTVVDMSLSPEAKRIAIAAASGALGQPVKLRVVPDSAMADISKRNGGAQFTPAPGGRNRAEQDPIVQRMREKFGAEIRTVIDYREKR